MTEPFTPEELEAARAEGFAPYGTEAAWIKMKRYIRDVVDQAPPLTMDQKCRLRALLAPGIPPAPKKRRRR